MHSAYVISVFMKVCLASVSSYCILPIENFQEFHVLTLCNCLLCSGGPVWKLCEAERFCAGEAVLDSFILLQWETLSGLQWRDGVWGQRETQDQQGNISCRFTFFLSVFFNSYSQKDLRRTGGNEIVVGVKSEAGIKPALPTWAPQLSVLCME